MPQTTRLHIPYPAETDPPDGPTQMQNLANAVDNVVPYSAGTLALRPTSTSGSPGINGRMYLATDDTSAGPNGSLYVDYGTGWMPIQSYQASQTATDVFQSGVVGGSHLSVTPPTGAGQQFVVNSGVAWLPDANGVLQRHILASSQNIAAPAMNSGGNARVDRLYAVYVGPNQAPTLTLVVGAANASAALPGAAGTAGAGAAPGQSVCIWEGLMGAGASYYTAGAGPTHWLDRRPWARGARFWNFHTGGNYTTSGSTYSSIDSANVPTRIECSNNPPYLLVSLRGTTSHTVTTNNYFAVFVDGSQVSGMERPIAVNGSWNMSVSLDWEFGAGSPGSHLIDIRWRTDAATATLLANSTTALEWEIREITGQIASNGNA